MGFSVARPLIDDLRSFDAASRRILIVENFYSGRRTEKTCISFSLFRAFGRTRTISFRAKFSLFPFFFLFAVNVTSLLVFVNVGVWFTKVVKTVISFSRYFLSHPIPLSCRDPDAPICVASAWRFIGDFEIFLNIYIYSALGATWRWS